LRATCRAWGHCAGARGHWSSQALRALHLFQRDQHYLVAEDKVQIVDEYTGRVMPDRTWERGLHQMIETKEGLELSASGATTARWRASPTSASSAATCAWPA
jgi:preprotein translocase subunit SecA